MIFDIIPITGEEIDKLNTIQLKLLRTAQQKKDALRHELENKLAEYRAVLYANGMELSALYDDFCAERTAECEYETEILREQLVFNLSLKEPTDDSETGGGASGGDETGYVVDYSLSYIDRYVAVRDYYLSIEDPDERIALLAADEVARNYLQSYYSTLFNYLVQFTK